MPRNARKIYNKKYFIFIAEFIRKKRKSYVMETKKGTENLMVGAYLILQMKLVIIFIT